MCVSRLQRVLEVGPDGSCTARDVDGRRHQVSLLAYEGGPLAAGDWIVVHSGYALTTVEAGEAEAAVALLQPVERARDRGTP